jgi:hypothetical protein
VNIRKMFRELIAMPLHMMVQGMAQHNGQLEIESKKITI